MRRSARLAYKIRSRIMHRGWDDADHLQHGLALASAFTRCLSEGWQLGVSRRPAFNGISGALAHSRGSSPVPKLLENLQRCLTNKIFDQINRKLRLRTAYAGVPSNLVSQT